MAFFMAWRLAFTPKQSLAQDDVNKHTALESKKMNFVLSVFFDYIL